VDWDGNADITTDTSVDLNHDGNLSVLRGNCNEWLKIQFKGGAVGSTGFEPARLAVEEEPADVDLTVEEYRRMKAASIPVP